MKYRIAIIGAGFGGLVLAHELSRFGAVTVFEKARGVGGRMSTRYADPYYFDHGAQCFTARTRPFQEFLAPFTESGTIARWQGDVLNLSASGKSPRIWQEPHLVAAPNMNSLCKALAIGLNVRLGTEVAPLGDKYPDGWHLFTKDGAPLGTYDWIISTAPPAQTLGLFGSYIDDESPIREARLKGCYALMIGFSQRWQEGWIAARVQDSPIKWISVNSTKPGRSSDVTCFVAHSRNDWAEQHINDDMGEAQNFLTAEFERLTGIPTRDAGYLASHRWRYAIVEDAPKSGPFLNPEACLASTSDWCVTSRIEEVWEAAMELIAGLEKHLV